MTIEAGARDQRGNLGLEELRSFIVDRRVVLTGDWRRPGGVQSFDTDQCSGEQQASRDPCGQSPRFHSLTH